MACKVQNINVIQNRLFHIFATFSGCDNIESIDSIAITAICKMADAKIAGRFKSNDHSIFISEITLAILRIFFYLREGKSESQTDYDFRNNFITTKNVYQNIDC